MIINNIINKNEYTKNFSRFNYKEKSLIFYPKNLNEIKKIITYSKFKKKKILCIGSSLSWYDTITNKNNYLISLKKYEKKIIVNKKFKYIYLSSNITMKEAIKIANDYNYSIASIPGNLDVTIGGCISNDVHGKDSFKNGNFSENVIELSILLPNKKIIKCSKNKNRNLFRSIAGGLGMIGIILHAKIRLIPMHKYYLTETYKCFNYKELIDTLYKDRNYYDFIYGWIDTYGVNNQIGRGIVFKSRKNYSNIINQKKIFFIINFNFIKEMILRIFMLKKKMKILNSIFFRFHKKLDTKYETQIQIIDTLSSKNIFLPKLIMPNSFVEIQIIIPINKKIILKKFLELCQKLKIDGLIVGVKMHKKNNCFLSFCDEGFSVGINSICNQNETKEIKKYLFLYKFIKKNKCKIYLCKDFFLNHDHFLQIYPKFNEFKKIRDKYDPKKLLNSDFFSRLFH